ncbi:MAG: bifunctional adenosylcobinamide kinase/adenosylcobinamide-phosphate guanylyltransferase [Pyramidobacter sp.]|nr:bifunctional adenosylcobinamide kinase/adenosylcobinamide-phosphate guanylyltransferase [Pyramidobacter sp.]
MLILVMGENNSGKSLCAEKIAARLGGRKIYAATMIPHGEEGRARVEKHRRQRAGMGFVTCECPHGVGALCAEGATVLLEDVSNLMANALFDSERSRSASDVCREILLLNSQAGALIAVTISGLEPDGWDDATRHYVNQLNCLNAQLKCAADTVIEMRGGEAHVVRGKCPWI